MLLNIQWIKDKITKKSRDKWKWKHDDPKSMGYSKNSSKEGTLEQCNPTPGNKKKFQINNLILYLKQLEKEEQAKPKDSRRKKYHKAQSRNKQNRYEESNKNDQWN